MSLFDKAVVNGALLVRGTKDKVVSATTTVKMVVTMDKDQLVQYKAKVNKEKVAKAKKKAADRRKAIKAMLS